MAIDTIKATAILDGAVDTADLADGAVTAAKLDAAAVTPTAVSDVDNTSTGLFTLPSGTTAQRPGTSYIGAQRFNTDLTVMEYYNGTEWLKVSSVIPVLNDATGNINNAYESTLTLSGQGFLSTNLVVNFTQSSDSVDVDVTVTPTSDTAATVTVPSSVYSNVTVGNVVSVKVTNSDTQPSGVVNKTVLAAPTGGTITTSSG